MRAKKNRINSGIALIWFALLLICLVMITGALTSGLLAKYGTASSGDAGARIARFDTNPAEFADVSVISVTAEGAEGASTSYDVVIQPRFTEVTTGYNLEVTLKNEHGITAWPAGLKLTVTNAAGTLIGTSTDGMHFYRTADESAYSDATSVDYFGIFYPGTTGAVTYRLTMQAGYTTIGGNYEMGLSVIMEQLD